MAYINLFCTTQRSNTKAQKTAIRNNNASIENNKEIEFVD
jgi:hypothetical protein